MPIRFTVDIVGSTSTLVSEQIEEAGLAAPPQIAGMLLSGLVSDTLILTSPTTTERDKKAAERLGVGSRGSLPGNAEIEAAVANHLQLFGGDAHEDRLRLMRVAALSAMELLASFTPRLVGPVLVDLEQHHPVQSVFAEEGVEGLGLRGGPGEAVEDVAGGCIVFADALLEVEGAGDAGQNGDLAFLTHGPDEQVGGGPVGERSLPPAPIG